MSANRQGRLIAHPAGRPSFWQKWTYTPLVVIGHRGQLGLNWRHPGAPFALVVYVLALPLVVLANVGDRAHRTWISRHERAALKRARLL